MNIGQLCVWLILNSQKSNDEIVKIVKTKFEDAKTTSSSVAWYRSDLRKKGLLGPREGRNKVVLTADELAKLAE